MGRFALVSERIVRGNTERLEAEWRLKDDLVKRFAEFEVEMKKINPYPNLACKNYNGEAAVALHEAVAEHFGDPIWLDHLGEVISSEAEKAETKPDGFVYILRAGAYYKIGKAKRLSPRIKQLRIQLPFSVEVWNAFPCEDHTATENGLHEWLKKHRMNGEWFELPDQKGVNWLAMIQYTTVPRGEYADMSPGFDHHYNIPATMWANESWSEALREAFAVREVDHERS